MSVSEKWKWAYRVVRSVLFTAIALVALIYAALFVTLSLPGVQRKVRDIAEVELTKLCGGDVKIGQVSIYPFNEVVVKDVSLTEPEGGERCLQIEKVGAGISLWNLVRHGKIIITYAELIGMDARVSQDAKDGPLNIQFLIDAFAPKDKNKPPTKFDLQIGNIVIRKGKASFDRKWQPTLPADRIDFNHLRLTAMNADVALPRLSNDRIEIDLRRLAFNLKPGLDVERISAYATIDHGDIDLKEFQLEMPSTRIKISDQHLPLSKYGNFRDLLASENLDVSVGISDLNPAEFAAFFPPLADLNRIFDIDLHLNGNASYVFLNRLKIADKRGGFSLNMEDVSTALEGKGLKSVAVGKFILKSDVNFNTELGRSLLPALNAEAERIISQAGNVDIDLKGFLSLADEAGDIDLHFGSGYGNADVKGSLGYNGAIGNGVVSVSSDNFNLGRLLNTDKVGALDFDLQADCRLSRKMLDGLRGGKGGKSPDYILRMIPKAELELDVESAVINGYDLTDLHLRMDKNEGMSNVDILCTDENFNIDLVGDLSMAGSDSSLSLSGDVIKFRPNVIGLVKSGKDLMLSAGIDINLNGDCMDNLTGSVEVNDILFADLTAGKSLQLNRFSFNSTIEGDELRTYSIESDWLSGNLRGKFLPGHLPKLFTAMLSESLPTLILPPKDYKAEDYADAADFNFTIFRNGDWMEFLNLPVKLLYEATITGSFDASKSYAGLRFDAPYIQQGRDKLIQHTSVKANLEGENSDFNFYSSIPTKKGVLDLNANIKAHAGTFDIALGLNPGSHGAFYGDLLMQANISPALNADGRDISLKFLPSSIWLNGAEWNVGESLIDYKFGRIEVSNFSISNESQFVQIAGTASALIEDEVIVKLQNIDLSYIFDTLNIDVAMFGGIATGEAVGKGLLSKDIQAFTRRLHVDNLSYNNSLLGDGELRGDFDFATKRVGIFADITEGKRRVANVDGGIWIGRDSLSFAFDADKVRVGFLQPFMKAFSSNVEGRASGKALLYGTFKNVNMKGRMMADSVAIKVDYTNVTYSGSDSIIIDPGHIRINRFTLHDRYGHTAELTGVLDHDYFHHPEFDFRITKANGLMLYDTNAKMNPIWYGRIFGSGTGRIVGNDDYVRIIADMTTQGDSDFTFVLDDSKEAYDYKFLSFTDKAKQLREAEHPEEISESDAIVRAFQKKVAQQVGPPSIFAMDIRATLTPAVKMTLVMDPVAGDKITARGEGPVNIEYDSASEAMKMYGKYTLSEGVYNFSLQDLILKDFLIKEGSSVSFNGDPMAALLNIRAAYRVNTNLTDLDLSFATDKDLNRVNVPVDAMLLVTGEMEHPEIKFDIELPTLNGETEQKVRSIISSEDMMNTQMIYLLALNRFYTPDYAGGGNSGGEWASVASSTLSSQLSNILSQMTDKITIAPSLRSDKGDFSDLQVDVALSSRLFNNRLLINGNLGYRDPSTSSTTFIGDFDIEYLLNRSGNLRLKAYNHFNDQNYYLKSALTTQGVGIVWRREFDKLFPRRKKRQAAADSIPASD